METQTLRVGLIGAGRIGRLHAKHLAHAVPGVRLTALADVSAEAAKACAEDCGIEDVEQDYHAVAQRPDIDAVVICSSTNTHAAIIRECAEAGKHIFCEKPIDLDIANVDAALAAVEAANVKLMVGFNRRFDANFARVKKALRKGEIGEPHLLHIISRDPAPPPIEYIRVSGGLFMDMTIHDFDMARFLIGSEVEAVYTTAAVRVDTAIGEADDVDTAVIVLRFANGVIGTIDNSRQAVYGYDQRVEILGSAGGIRVDNNYPNTASISTAETVRRDLPLNFFMERYADSYLAEMKEFVDSVVNDKAVPVTGADARAAMLLAMAVRKSCDENRPVTLDELR